MSIKFEILPGLQKDVEDIVSLYDTVTGYLESHINYPGWRKGIYPTREDAQKGINEGTLSILKIQGKIAGSIVVNGKQEKGYESVTWKSPAKQSDVAVIHTFMVHPDYKKMGFGEKLLEFAEETAKKQGKDVIRLDVYEKNAPAIRLYKRMGYCFAGTADLGYSEYGLDLFQLYEKRVGERHGI